MNIPISNSRQKLIVDDSDYDLLSRFNWCLNGTGHAKAVIAGSKQYIHRFIMGLMEGDGMTVDHRNHNTLDNRRSNLRVCTNSQNCANKKKASGKSSGYKGVTWFKRDNCWKAQIKVNYRNIHLGYFDKEADAAAAYNKSAIRIFGEFALINKI